MIKTIDLNADLGEGYGPWAMGDDAAMLGLVTSANIACGGHASDPETMFRALTMARANGVTVGAHPSYPDLLGFGRRRLPYSPAEVQRFVAAQTGALIAIAALAGTAVRYVKPHGALGNVASEDRAVADAVVTATRALDRELAILAISGTVLEHTARDAGVRVYCEVFADRGYTDTGNLVPRGQPGAILDDAEAATARMLRFLETGRMPTAMGGEVALAVDSICVHGDSPHAVATAERLRGGLEAAGLRLKAFAPD